MPQARVLLLVLPLFVLAAALEGGYLSLVARRSYDWRAYFASLGDALGRLFINRVVGFGLAGAILAVVAQRRVGDISMHHWWSWPALVVAQDFCYYWLHRADHRVRWLWATHAVHHSSNAYNFSAAYRLGWTSGVSGGAIFFAPLVWIGFPLQAVLVAVSLNLLYQFWLHTELIPRLGPLEWVFNTPAHHRVHHASNPEYIDRNFGGVLIVFDRLFGTFAATREEVTLRYGLTKPVQTYNPARIAFHEWANLGRDVVRAPSLSAALRTLFGHPP
ncbi:MAG TPA: sterol desaturase family protein [Rudaea sp.]|nr:sterol desaturase family protein [Rudaea sp.]